KDSQLVIATHSPIIMSYPDALIYAFGEQGVRAVAYKETEHYRVTRSFLESPERMLSHLLK
ncbi:MAG: ABC transporter ATP-binding protein, partial [Pirellula sp.]